MASEARAPELDESENVVDDADKEGEVYSVLYFIESFSTLFCRCIGFDEFCASYESFNLISSYTFALGVVASRNPAVHHLFEAK